MGWFKKIKKKIPNVIYIKRFPKPFPEFTEGLTIGPISFIEEYKNGDKGLAVHEAVHRAQWRKSKKMFWIRYAIKKYRLRYEIEAFAAQSHLAVSSYERQKKFKKYARYIHKYYKTGISERDAERKLKEYYVKHYIK